MAPKVDTKPMIETSDMPKPMRDHAMRFVEPLILQQMSDDELANQLREAFDKAYGRGWNCLVGRDFGAYVQHEPRTLAFFYVDRTAVMIFKAK
uniref:Dynein light chain n=1 Tax=Panagrellus redivivus TaxID=6233 RepID=A0A7E4WAN0_PANRE